jgi:hypothetical protein
MFEIIVSCKGVSESAAQAGLSDLLEEFSHRPWHSSVKCHLADGRIILHACNDYDSTGQALLDEFSDAVCACFPIEDATISFSIESVVTVPGSDA